ncbi:MAG: bacteriohemerythrin [Alphaproteobacteria bacterium]|nr:bacteriohemerythrin [Alphaproteobacteria bacterium]
MTAVASPIDWDEALNFGVKELDVEHQELVALVNLLDEVAAAGAPEAEVGAVLDDLVALVDHHIAHEHALLEEYGYGECSHHAAADRKFFRIFTDLRAVFGEHGTLNVETRDFIKHLIIQHIIKTDKPLRDFFRGRMGGGRPDENPYIHWLDSFAIGVAPIDHDHRAFIDLVNQLKDAVDSGAPREELLDITIRFARHAREHFRREESLLRLLRFPGFEEHHQEHADLLEQLTEALADVEAGRRGFGREELLLLIKEWIIRHILFVDMKMKSFLDEQ